MPNDNATKQKRKINARATALRSVGKSDEQIADAILAFEDLTPSLRNKLKQAKADGRAKDAIEGLISATKVSEPTTQPEDLKTKGILGGVSDFLGIEKVGRRIGSELAMLDPQHRRNLESLSPEEAETIKTGGVSNKEAIGSAGNLALNLAGGAILKTGARALGYGGKALGGFSRVAGGARSLTPAQLARRPVATIAGGAGIGYASDVASGLNDNESIGEALTPGIGTVTGGVLGAAPMARNLFAGRGALGNKAQKQTESLLAKVTPDLKDIPEKEYKKLLAQGRITPRTATKPAQYILSDRQISAATRHADLIDPDPVKTTLNIGERVSELDNEVGTFLSQNNGVFNGGELKNAIQRGMKDISDVSVPEERIEKVRQQMVDNFVDTLESKNMYSLWQARKNFDQKIESAFSGSPTLQKEMKVAFRNAVQDFIAEKTPNKTYKNYMKDMSSLIELSELTQQSAAKERGYSLIGNWMKDNPNKARVLGASALVAGGAIGGALGFRSLTGGSPNE